MKYLALFTPAPNNAGPATPEHRQAMGKLVEEQMRSGTLIMTEPFSGSGVRVRRSNGDTSVGNDGHFTDEKGRAAGFAILRADSREEAIEACRRFLEVAGDGHTDLLEIMDMAETTPR